MKKVFSLLIVLVLLLAVFSACDGGGASSVAPASQPESTTGSEPASQEEGSSEAASDLDFPTQNITIVVPFDAGGGNDIMGRLVANAAMENGYLNGVNIIIENMPGGGGAIGQAYVAQTAPADGYTLITYTGSVITNAILKDVAFDVDDYRIIVGCNPDPAVLVAANDAPFDTLEEFIEYAQSNTVLLNDSGFGTSSHIRCLQVQNTMLDRYGIELNFDSLHTDSGNMQLVQLMGGHADASFITAGECADAVAEGQVKAIAVLDSERLDVLPDVPTFLEAGYEGFIDGADRAIACAKDVPDDVYNYLVEEFQKICTSPEFIESMENANMIPASKRPEVFQEYINDKSAMVESLKDFLLEEVS